MTEYAKDHRLEIHGITPEAMTLLETESWPSNVRGLASVIENAVFRSTGPMIDVDVVLQALGRQTQRKAPTIERTEIATLPPDQRRTEPVIRRALEIAGGNGAAAAELLGIPLRSFRRYTRKYNIRKRFWQKPGVAPTPDGAFGCHVCPRPYDPQRLMLRPPRTVVPPPHLARQGAHPSARYT
jgi:DNA-binding NtrC family response regulator